MEPKFQQWFTIVAAITAVFATSVAFWYAGSYTLNRELNTRYEVENEYLYSKINNLQGELNDTRNVITKMSNNIDDLLMKLQILQEEISRKNALNFESDEKPAKE